MGSWSQPEMSSAESVNLSFLRAIVAKASALTAAHYYSPPEHEQCLDRLAYRTSAFIGLQPLQDFSLGPGCAREGVFGLQAAGASHWAEGRYASV